VHSETFFVRGGSIDVLASDHLLTASNGDLVVLPQGNAHAFAAAADQWADVLVVVTPGATGSNR
jgi:quercetin dioxygenase-like cupin family protein